MNDRLHSIVVPVYNSKDTLEVLVNRVSKAMDNAGLQFELVLVDDASQDGSFEEIRRLSESHLFVRGFRLSRNFGHQLALIIGLRKSRGDFVAIIDDDLQDPPEILPGFFERLGKDADVVYGVRRARKESFAKRVLYAAFYRILRVFSRVDIPLDAGDFCVMKRCVVDAMLECQESNPFLRGIRSWVGFTQVGMEYPREARLQGESGYTMWKYFRLAVAGILSFSYVPLRLATMLGAVTALVGFAFTVYVICARMFGTFDAPGYASLVSMIAFLGGVQLVTIGILGEYLARLSENTRRWPAAIIKETTSGNKE